MLASAAAAHGHMSAPGSMCCHALGHGAIRLALDGASIPAPSIRGRAAALGRPAQGGRVAHALALYRRLAGPQSVPSFFATAPPLAAWAGGSRGPERFVRHGGRQAAPSGGPRLRLVACVSSPPALRSPVGARFGFPSPARPLLCFRWPGPGALGSWGAGGALLRRRLGPSGRLAPPGFCPPPPCRLASPGGGCAAAVSHTEVT